MKHKSNNIRLVFALIGVLILVSKFQYSVTTPTECQDANPVLKTYFSTVADFDIGLVSHYGVTLTGNSIIKTLGSSSYCTKEIVQSCPVGTISTVGAEAKGQTWATTIPCSNGWYCADQLRQYDTGCSETRTDISQSVTSCSSPCSKSEEICAAWGGMDTGGCGTWTNPWYGTIVSSPCAFASNYGQINAVVECKKTSCSPPTPQTISYGCKPDPNYVPTTPCPASWRNYCGGNELRKSDGCTQDVWMETCQYGCNTATVACNPAPVVASCAWTGITCVEGDAYRIDSVCNKQEIINQCQYGCLNGQCNPAPVVTYSPLPTFTSVPTPIIPGYVPAQTPIQPIPADLEAKSLNTNVFLLIIGLGGIALWFLFGKGK